LEFPSVVTRSSGLVCCLLAFLSRRSCKASSCLSVVVGCVVVRVTLRLYRVAFIGVVSAVLDSSSMNPIHLPGCILGLGVVCVPVVVWTVDWMDGPNNLGFVLIVAKLYPTIFFCH
jgi:ABC-type Fe3+ transport system permease subunit